MFVLLVCIYSDCAGTKKLTTNTNAISLSCRAAGRTMLLIIKRTAVLVTTPGTLFKYQET